MRALNTAQKTNNSYINDLHKKLKIIKIYI